MKMSLSSYEQSQKAALISIILLLLLITNINT